MSEVPDGSGQMPRRAPRAGDGGAPVSGALAIVLAVVAVVAGFLILRSISDGGDTPLDFDTSAAADSDDADGGDDETDDDATAGGTTVPTLPPTTTVPPIVTAGADVIVANANGVGGSASSMTRALETGAGFTLVDPTNASSTIGDIEESVIYYDAANAAAQSVAESLGRVLGGVGTVAPMPETPPTIDGELNGAGVLLMLGNDKAGKTLAELAPEADTGVAVVTNPTIAGSAEG
ncbi:MAG: LytR C-terminal domain-containing protein [Ilumatobacter sp.]|uniref:LytR C-terminal domain-containing protein n=1 Tax=Ilumatobacter sp. TaxID=1967498 RepID=UPI0026397EF3|nr:LytR C-terminal domain-containing protein [Ilumatobacter sp.]MDJ0770950.1 LytR C-terminal domain-containing protein [Ilumatobacter sp.]